MHRITFHAEVSQSCICIHLYTGYDTGARFLALPFVTNWVNVSGLVKRMKWLLPMCKLFVVFCAVSYIVLFSTDV